MKKLITIFFTFCLSLLTYLLSATSAQAVCPVCTIAVGAGLGLSRYFGIDDTISGLWVGGLILSTALWSADWIHKRGLKIKLKVLNIASALIFYLITLLPLYYSGIIGHPLNTIYGIDKILYGTVLGSFIFLLALSLDKLVRKINGRQFFVYQKVVFPVTGLLIISLIFFLVLKH